VNTVVATARHHCDQSQPLLQSSCHTELQERDGPSWSGVVMSRKTHPGFAHLIDHFIAVHSFFKVMTPSKLRLTCHLIVIECLLPWLSKIEWFYS